MCISQQKQWELSLAENETQVFMVLQASWSLGLPKFFCKHLTAKLNVVGLFAFKSEQVKVAWGVS